MPDEVGQDSHPNCGKGGRWYNSATAIISIPGEVIMLVTIEYCNQ